MSDGTTPHTLFVVRGRPGSGKTTLARIIAPGANYAADDYFEAPDGSYRFDAAQLAEAHAACRDGVAQSMVQGHGLIAVHNTFSRRWEYEPYLDLAARHGYRVQIVTCEGDHGSVHAVPDHVVAAMKARWENAT